MRELDFLPQSHHDAVRRKLHTRRNVFMCIGLVMAMTCLHGLNLTRIRSAQAALADLHNGSGGWQSARSEFKALEAQKARCRQQLDLINRLEDAAPLDAVVGEATRLLTDSMAITGFCVDATSATPAGTPDKPAPPSPSSTRVRINALAATDVEVGIFLGKLGSCPLFTDVTLSYSRDTHNAGRRMREFEVKFTLRPVEIAS